MNKTQTIFAAFVLLLHFCTAPVAAQWLPTNGINGAASGRFQNYGDTILYLGGNRLFYTTNDGASWATFPNFPNTDRYILNFTVCDHNILAIDYQKIHHSKDGGATWSTLNYPVPLSSVEAYIQQDTLVIISYGGSFKTGDGGINWTPILQNYPLGDIQYADGALTAIHYPYVVRSTDLCATFDTLKQFTGNPIIFKKLGEKLFLLMQSAGQGCWFSPNDGQTWQQFSGTSFDQYQSLFALGNDIYASKSSFINKSSNNGQTWTPLQIPDNEYFADAIGRNGIILGASIYGGIFRSTDAANSWFSANFGLNNASVNSFSMVDNNLHVSTPRAIHALAPDQINWSPLPISLIPDWTGHQQYVKSGTNLLLLSNYSIFVSVDDGVTWVESFIANNGFSLSNPLKLFVMPSRIFAYCGGDLANVLVSENNGLSFQQLNQQYHTALQDCEILLYEQGKLFSKTWDDKLYASEDEGNTWTLLCDLPLTPSGGIFYGSVFLAGDNILYFSNNVINNQPQYYAISNDSGQTWVTKDNKIDYLGFDYIYQLKKVGNYAIATTNRGVFISEDHLQTWTPWNDGLNTLNTKWFEFFDKHIWLSTLSGIFKRPLSELGIFSAKGRVFYDINNNGVEDTGDVPAENVAVKSLTSGSFTTTGNNGQFAFLSNLPSEELAVQPPTPYFTVSPASISTAVPSEGASFALQSNPDAHDLAVSITNTIVLRPGFETNYVIHWGNNGPNPAQNISISANFPEGVINILETSPVHSAQIGNNLTWNISNLPIGASGAILIRVEVPVTVALGTEVCVPVSIQQNNPDIYPLNNSDESCTTVVGSYDPNDKQANPSERITPTQIATGMPIDYTVRFQNTGTYFATFVRILDTIQAGFDPSTFRFVASSHPCTWTIRANNIVEFFFDNILLPDQNTNEPGSHGFVRYTIQPLPNLPLGTPLNNTAHIFFDYNSAIVTNTTQTLVQNPAKTTEPELATALQIWPNPARTTAQVTHPVTGGQLEIRDATGRLLLSKNLEPGRNMTELDLRHWPAGHYDVHWKGENAVLTRKLVVVR